DQAVGRCCQQTRESCTPWTPIFSKGYHLVTTPCLVVSPTTSECSPLSLDVQAHNTVAPSNSPVDTPVSALLAVYRGRRSAFPYNTRGHTYNPCRNRGLSSTALVRCESAGVQDRC